MDVLEDGIASKKKVKDAKNSRMRSEQLPVSSSNESFDRLRNLYLKTEEMKAVAEAKNKEMEDTFKELQERLNTSSGFLNQMKRSIDNLKFSCEQDVVDLETFTGENCEDIDRQIEETREYIRKLQSKVKDTKPKPQTYQEAFTDVLTNFQNIAEGKYKNRNME